MSNLIRLIPLIVGAVAAGTFAGWIAAPKPEAQPRLPGADNEPPPKALEGPAPNLRGILIRSDHRPSDLPGHWPNFRGPASDGKVHEDVALADTWPEDGPKELWSIEVGEGHAGAAVANGCVYILDYDDRRSSDIRDDDIRRPFAFCQRLVEQGQLQAASPARRIWQLLDEQAREAATRIASQAAEVGPPEPAAPPSEGPMAGVTVYGPETYEQSPVDPKLRSTLIEGLNKVIAAENFYRQQDFQNLTLGEEAKKYRDRFADGLATKRLERFNRLLIDAAFEGMILPAWPGDVIRCLSLEDGREIWRYLYPVLVKRNHGMSRSIPAVADGSVVALGPMGHATCVDAATGELKWGMDFVREYGTVVPEWWASQSPIIENSRAIFAPAGSALMIAVDLDSGQTVWSVPNPDGWNMSHASIIPMEYAGRRMYVYVAGLGTTGNSAGVIAVSPEGQIVWKTDEWAHRVAAPSAVYCDQGRVFVSAGYGVGSILLQMKVQDEGLTVEVIDRLGPTEFGSEQQTPVYHDGVLLATLGRYDAGEDEMQFACLKPTGEHLWTSGRDERFGLGPYILADGKIYVLNDEGVLTMLRLSKDRYQKLGRAKVLPGHDSWAPITLTGGRMIIRDLTNMTCLDLRKQ